MFAGLQAADRFFRLMFVWSFFLRPNCVHSGSNGEWQDSQRRKDVSIGGGEGAEKVEDQDVPQGSSKR